MKKTCWILIILMLTALPANASMRLTVQRYDRRVVNNFEGFEYNRLFELDDGSCWIQSESHLSLHLLLSPRVAIARYNGKIYLVVDEKEMYNDDNAVWVQPVQVVRNSRIDGNFEGWTGDTIIKLADGSIWQQIEYAYAYSYHFSPRVKILNVNGRNKAFVEGCNKAVAVRQLR